jgi:hypothetical protein
MLARAPKLPGLLIAAALALFAADPQASLIPPLQLVSGPGRTEIRLQFDRPVRYEASRLRNPDRVYVDLFDVSAPFDWTGPSAAPDDPLVRRVRAGRPAPNTTRLVVDLKSGVDFSVDALTDPPRLVVVLRPEGLRPETAAVARGSEPAPVANPPSAPYRRAPNAWFEAPLPPLGWINLPSLTPLPPSRLPVPGAGTIGPTAPPATAPVAVASSPVIAPVAPLIEAAPGVNPTDSARRLTIPRLEHAPRIEDFLDGNPRNQTVEVRGFLQREPHDGSPVSQPTTTYLAFDDNNLFVIFVCHDDPAAIRAHMTKREDIGGDDTVAVYLDTFHDRHRAYVFESNPLGIQRDAIVTEGEEDADYNFDTVWDSEGRLTSFGFVVQFSIPFKSLRFSGAKVQQWGIALARNIPRNNEESYWPYITAKVQGLAQQMATLDGLERISPGRNVQLIPYITASNSRFLASGPGLTTSNDVRGGVDGKVILKDALTFDFTANPDFSQVESDDPQVTVNQRYEVYFPEKRPFFLDNSAYFSTPVNLFYSRRVVDPNAGARLSGKVGPWTLGFLATDDRAPGQSVDSSDPLHGGLTPIGVARVAREFGQQSSVGMFFSDRQFGTSFNRVYSLDWRLKLNNNWSVKTQAIRSYDRALDGTRSVGSGLTAEAVYSDRHLIYSGSYTDFTPGFRAPLGFIQRVDIRQEGQYASYMWRPDHGPVSSFGPTLNQSFIFDHTGRLTDWSGGAQFDITFRGPTRLSAYRYQTYEYYLGQGFHKAASGFSYYTASRRWLDLYGSYATGNAVNYSPALGIEPFLARSDAASFGATVHLPRLRLEQYYLFSRLAGGSTPDGLTVFNNHIARSKLNYQFSRALSLRAIVDYYVQLPNESLVQQTHLKQVTTDVLLTYLIHPGTAAYIGYTNRFQNLVPDPLSPPTLVSGGPPTFQTDRLLFLKLSYLFHF